MPAINVAKTDTFELQRQKINTIGQQIFSVTEGGSDLTTGNLKLGDGTLASPSLSFASENGLGVYKPSTSLFGLAVSNKRIINFGLTTTSYSTFDYIKTSVNTVNNNSIPYTFLLLKIDELKKNKSTTNGGEFNDSFACVDLDDFMHRIYKNNGIYEDIKYFDPPLNSLSKLVNDDREI